MLVTIAISRLEAAVDASNVRAIARRVDCQPSTIRGLLAGSQPRPSTARALQRILGISLTDWVVPAGHQPAPALPISTAVPAVSDEQATDDEARDERIQAARARLRGRVQPMSETTETTRQPGTAIRVPELTTPTTTTPTETR